MRPSGIEPELIPWEGIVIPLDHGRYCTIVIKNIHDSPEYMSLTDSKGTHTWVNKSVLCYNFTPKRFKRIVL